MVTTGGSDKRPLGWLGIMFVLAVQCACGAEYELSPRKMDGSKANVAVYCMTPVGWQGWKDDPHYLDGVAGLNRELLEDAHAVSVYFLQQGCKHRPRCPSLSLDTKGLKPGQQVNMHTELESFVRQVEQHQKPEDPDPSVARFGSFESAASSRWTIWQIHCSFYDDYLLTMTVQDNVLITIYLQAREAKRILGKVDSLKELARSVRVVRRD